MVPVVYLFLSGKDRDSFDIGGKTEEFDREEGREVEEDRIHRTQLSSIQSVFLPLRRGASLSIFVNNCSQYSVMQFSYLEVNQNTPSAHGSRVLGVAV